VTAQEIILTLIFTVVALGFFFFAITSWIEKHHRAALFSVALTVLSLIILGLIFVSQSWLQNTSLFLMVVGLILAGVWITRPFINRPNPSPPPNTRVDERTIMFARARLEPGTPEFEGYYKDHPEHFQPDQAFRKHPGLLAPGSIFYDKRLASMASSAFTIPEALRDAVEGPITNEVVSPNPKAFATCIKSLAKYLGAVDIGICELQPYHIYSHIGRGSGFYGAPITLNHQFAIAFTVEMTHEMIQTAPKMPAVMESARQYAEAAKIAVILGEAIRELGYPARAHIDGNYRVIAPLVAKDAGLGEIGRMGLLMTPRLGPRVRLGVLTTDLPLIVDPPIWDPTVIDFCEQCQKCALGCPAQAIPFDDRRNYEDGSLRWKIDSEKCYTYWTKVGTDCGRCMAVCPYSHPDTLMHNLIRFGVQNSANFRKAALKMDDLFYGKKPKPYAPPKWVRDVQEGKNNC